MVNNVTSIFQNVMTPLDGFNPVDGVSNRTRLWLDPSDTSTITHTANAVDTITDKANGYIFTTESGFEPVTNTVTRNNRNILDYDGTQFLKNTANVTDIWKDDITCFTVLTVDPITTNNNIALYAKDGVAGRESGSAYNGLGGGSVLEWHLGASSSDRIHGVYQSDSGAEYSQSVVGTVVTNQIIGIYSKTVVNNEMYLDNRLPIGISAGPSTVKAASVFLIGAHGSTDSGLDRNFEGQIGETIILDGYVKPDDRHNIVNYLNAKWG